MAEPGSRHWRGRHIKAELYQNPDNDARGSWLAADVTAPGRRPALHYAWNGHLPPEGRHWRFSLERMEGLQAEGLLYHTPAGAPRLKRYLSEVPVPEAERHDEDAASIAVLAIVRQSMQALAAMLARAPGALKSLEWRDLERVLREVFEGLGFRTELTRGSKDGGFDLVLLAERVTYLIEVKHWTTKAVGAGVVGRFAEVVVRERAERGLLLSGSGFTESLMRGRCEVERHKVALGDAIKIVSLCQCYVAGQAGIWTPTTTLPELLFDGTA